jgi:hypothetical protein
MAVSNGSRTGRRQVALYLSSDEVTELTRVAEQMGETKNTVLRVAWREYLRRLTREKRIAEATAAQTELPPHSGRVTGIECAVYGGRENRREDLAAWLRARVSRDYPHATIKLDLRTTGFARTNLLWAIASGTLTEAEKKEVEAHLDRALRETFEQCHAMLV